MVVTAMVPVEEGNMAFMQKQVEYFSAWHVETTCGTECVPRDVCYSRKRAHLKDYLEGEQRESAELVTGWFSRLSAPGYMDCTEWSGPYDTEQAAREALDEMCGDDDSEDDAA